jgi:drug/metabolite transporter (DMT)-like permease
VFAPAAKGALAHLPPVRAAGFSYLAAGSVALLALGVATAGGATLARRRFSAREAPRLAGIILAGGVLGPVLFFAGVDRMAAHQAALIQHLEFALTVLAALLVLGERPGRRGLAGLALVAAGLWLFSVSAAEAPAESGRSWPGAILLAGACLAWATDNTLARGASDLDPLVVVAMKGLAAGAALVLVSARERWVAAGVEAWGAVVLAGGVGVGLSLILELLALRRIGAVLNAGLFATGPAFGFLWSLVFLREEAGAGAWLALGACALGAVALSSDHHEHWHVHEPIRHTHRHHHLDGHHTHSHGPGFDPATEHVHEHAHERIEHAHAHVHDEHHRHRH